MILALTQARGMNLAVSSLLSLQEETIACLFVCNALARSVCVCRPGKGLEITLQHTACQACPAYLLGVFHLVIQDLTRLEILPSPED